MLDQNSLYSRGGICRYCLHFHNIYISSSIHQTPQIHILCAAVEQHECDLLKDNIQYILQGCFFWGGGVFVLVIEYSFLCCAFCVVCLRSLSCLLNVASVSDCPFLIAPFCFLYRLFKVKFGSHWTWSTRQLYMRL